MKSKDEKNDDGSDQERKLFALLFDYPSCYHLSSFHPLTHWPTLCGNAIISS